MQSLKTAGTSPPFRSEVLHRDFDNGTGLSHMIKGHINKRKYVSKFKKQTIEPFETLNPYDQRFMTNQANSYVCFSPQGNLPDASKITISSAKMLHENLSQNLSRGTKQKESQKQASQSGKPAKIEELGEARKRLHQSALNQMIERVTKQN